METTESELCTIDCAIADHERKLANIDATIRERNSDKRRSAIELSYLELAALLRKPTTKFELWPIGLLLIAPLVLGAVCFSLIVSFRLSVSTSVLMAFVVYVLALGAIWILLFRPSQGKLQEQIDFIRPIHDERIAALREFQSQSTTIRNEIASLKSIRQKLVASVRYEREQLLKRNWKDLRGYDWERYLVEVFRALGAKVEWTGKSGDYGADLVVEFGPRRIAIQAKGYDNAYSVNLDAVKEAYLGMAVRSCTSCAVITNTRFGTSAIVAAESTRCVLIGEAEFPDFVMGKIQL